MKKLDEITIADLMPDSISGDAEVSATARAIDPQLKIISEGVDLPLILAAIDTLGEGVLEHLAAQYDLTAWDSAWPIDTKRAVLKTAIADKRKKGTRGAVQRAIEAVAPIATITEWWQTQSEMAPHTFRIDVLQDGSAVDAETQADVIAQVNDAKPERSHFTFSVGQQAQGNLYLSGVIRAIAYARVRSSGMTAVQTEIDAGVLAALRGMNIRRIMEFSHMGDMPEPTPVVPSIPMGGVLTATSDQVILVPVEQAGGVVEVYSPTPALPTVTVISGIVGNDSSYGSRNISVGGSVYQWVNNGGTRELATVASGNVIAFQRIANGSGENVKYSGFDAQITQDGYVQVTNNTGSSYSGAFGLTTAVCSSDLATVVTVYNSSNVAYNAFKFTASGTDYYYVLDGTQTDWTDDLSAIGY